jgi:hypothetical protein
MNCLIENEYIKGKNYGKKRGKKTEKTKRKNKPEKKGKNRKKNGKTSVGVLYYAGGFIILSRDLAYFIAGGLLTPCGHYSN